jgi:predicted Zn-dependent protease
VNGHQRELESQADRLGLQNVIEHGYDPREAANFSRIIINSYGDRSVIRGSFLTVQLMKEYPDSHWDGTKTNNPAFQSMKEDLGPVKIM